MKPPDPSLEGPMNGWKSGGGQHPSLSFIALFLTLVCSACANSCRHPAGVSVRSSLIVLLSFSYSLFTLIFPCVRLSICLYSSVIYLSFMSVLHPVFPSFLTRSRLIYVIPCIFFSTYSSPSSSPCANLVICDCPLPSFHCCLFPLHSAPFSAAVLNQARTVCQM